MKFATQFSPRKHIALKFTKPSLTKQAPANEVDINKIMERYLQTGELPEGRTPVYGDATAVPDFQEAMNIVVNAQNAFDALPSNVRARFGNDPAQLLEFIRDDVNYDEAVKLGLVAAKEKTVVEVSTSTADSVPVATQTGEAPASA